VDDRGALTHVVSVERDISEERRLREQLRLDGQGVPPAASRAASEDAEALRLTRTLSSKLVCACPK
jgi:hypothetical protein